MGSIDEGGDTESGPPTVYLKVRADKLLWIMWWKPTMSLDPHKPTNKCIIGNEYVLSC